MTSTGCQAAKSYIQTIMVCSIGTVGQTPTPLMCMLGRKNTLSFAMVKCDIPIKWRYILSEANTIQNNKHMAN